MIESSVRMCVVVGYLTVVIRVEDVDVGDCELLPFVHYSRSASAEVRCRVRIDLVRL